MWKQLVAGVFVIAFVMAGCNTEETRPNVQDDNTYDPLETTDKRNTKTDNNELRRGAPNKIKQDAEEDMKDTTYNISNRAHDNDFYNEKSMEVTRAVNELPEVSIARAIVSENRVIVGVMPTNYAVEDHDIEALVKEKVAEVSDADEVIVNMNVSEWERMKDLESRMKAAEGPKQIQKEINEFLNNFKTDNDRG
ncbi:hypothetical protein GCM10007216_24410 [Thalassobacillus devorans]|uniref:Sporulation lipoprotein YhcN/YlaJ n=1 Tax=Thalassobacillus devorans TaxID=279813 RepID=A0ABQ1PBH0_9BACI|nr:YhcN/YlaJ family sporulation lipoprotein [Thalassobacillus devorans]NIK29782.1 hypothetical protein [Thalassobacillus devorans]GGC92769.1 hypothetical protein GCM10007216_24410 [Thalassobacillus devorans]